MERAEAVPRASLLDRVAWEGLDRVHLGPECCERLLPTLEELRTALALVEGHGAALTLVTPPVTDAGLERLGPLLNVMPSGAEVVCNDWGALELVREAGLEPVLGRLLHKQKSDPRIPRVRALVTEEAWEHFRSSSADVPAMRRLLSGLGVRRVEVENTVQGLAIAFADGAHPLRGSLHHPYACVSVTRYCLLALATARRGRPEWGVFPCDRACERAVLRLDHPTMGLPLTLAGCAMFARNDRLPPEGELARMGIDRLVEARGPPA